VETLLRIALWNVALGAVLAALAFAVSRSTRRPALAHVLWVLALVKLLTPPLWIIGVAPDRARPNHLEPTPLVPVDSVPTSTQESRSAGPRAVGELPHRVTPQRSGEWVLPAVLIVWGSGSLAWLAMTLARIRQFRRALRHAVTDARLQARVDDLAAQIGLRNSPGVRLVPGRVCPMVWWTFGRPRLLVPIQLWSGLSESKRDALILHELAHLKRRDHWVRVIELLATVLYWWDPAVWWARHELRIAEEQCCDAWVTRAMPASGQVYASALVDAIEFISSSGSISTPRLPALASGMGEFRHLQRRLVMIQQGMRIRPLGWTGFAVICAAALALPLSFTRGQSVSRQAGGPSAHDTPNGSPPATRPAEEDEPGSAALYNHMVPDVSFEGVGLSDVLSFLRDVSGANIFVNWKALDAASVDRNAPVTVQMKHVKFSKVLDMVLESAGGGQSRLAYYFNDNVLTISTADDAGKMTVTRVYDVRDLLPPGDAKGRADELVKAIVNSCASDSWKTNGGSVGAVTPVDSLLVVVQTEENQRLVKDLLAKTRKAKQEASGR
jgi:beta-lactamase regulating signal transducer with metallopeptidase domain